MRRRLDREMVRRGLVADSAEAAEAIRSGKVTVSGRPAAKAGTLILPEEPIRMAGPSGKFVSRGGEKLEAALDRFGVDVSGRHALDAGASTGGFTDCLLSRGAAQVVAVDVGYGQLDWRLRQDPRVTLLERTNVRDLEPGQVAPPPDVVTADLSFISLATVLPALVRSAAPDATFLLLVKPQFEAEPGAAPGGVVRDPEVWRSALTSISSAVTQQGLTLSGLVASPVRGRDGNVEFLLHAFRSPAPSAPEVQASLIDDAVREAEAMVSHHATHA